MNIVRKMEWQHIFRCTYSGSNRSKCMYNHSHRSPHLHIRHCSQLSNDSRVSDYNLDRYSSSSAHLVFSYRIWTSSFLVSHSLNCAVHITKCTSPSSNQLCVYMCQIINDMVALLNQEIIRTLPEYCMCIWICQCIILITDFSLQIE